MKLAYCRPLVIGVLAITWVTASLAEAQPMPLVESSAPRLSVSPAIPPAPPIRTGTRTADPADLTAPPTEARRETLADCMSFWDPGTHMSKTEWRETCKRTLNGRVF